MPKRLDNSGVVYTKHPLYGVYRNILSRCYTKLAHAYEHYGGRGIDVCIEWRTSFLSFKKWCEENGWQKGLEIDREDNNKGYSPENCRCVTRKVNANNNRRNVIIEYNNTKKSLQEWAKELNIAPATLYARIFANKHPLEKALVSGLYDTKGRNKSAGKYFDTMQKIKCIETGKVYESSIEAAKDLKISSSLISLVLNKKQKTAKKMTFEKV